MVSAEPEAVRQDDRLVAERTFSQDHSYEIGKPAGSLDREPSIVTFMFAYDDMEPPRIEASKSGMAQLTTTWATPMLVGLSAGNPSNWKV